MAVQPCPSKVTCPSCYDPPLLNLSAEGEDRIVFYSNVPVIPFVPPTGYRYEAWACGFQYVSDISQEDANAGARQFLPCNTCENPPCDPPQPCEQPPCDPDPCTDPPCDPVDCPIPPCGPVVGNYLNAAQTCTLQCDDSTTFTHTVPAGALSSPFSQADADARALALCQQQVAAFRICFSSEPPNGCLNEAYFWQATATGGVAPYTFTMPGGALPTGVSFLPSGALAGIPTSTGAFIFDLVLTDSEGRTNTRAFTFYIAEITSPTILPGGQTSVAYSETLTAVGAPVGALWAVVSGALPTGLTLNPSTGVISGTPTVLGDFSFRVELSLA